MEWYQVVKTINGRKYLYWQKTYRQGGSVKTRNKYIGPAFGRNDRVLLVHKVSGARQWRTIKRVAAHHMVVVDDVSGIPYKAALDDWHFKLAEKGDPNAPSPKTGITFKELAEQEAAAEEAERRINEPTVEHGNSFWPLHPTTGKPVPYFCKRCETPTDTIDWEGRCPSCAA